MDEIKFKVITSREVEKKLHDQSFSDYIRTISQYKTNKGGLIGVKTRELAERVGINYEMFRKILNRQKPNQPRDCIIAICAALFLSVDETNEALFYYDDLPRLDDTSGCRDFYIIQTLEGNIGRDNDLSYLSQGVDSVNRILKKYDFSELRLSNKFKGIEPRIISNVNSDIQNYRTFTEISSTRFEFQRSLCEIYHPHQYQARTKLVIVDSSKEEYYLEYENSKNIIYKYKENEKPDVITDDDKLFINYSSILKDTNIRELRSCYELIYDTRNYGSRTSAKFLKDKIIFFSESYNYIHPEKNEYFYVQRDNGTFTFKILKRSGFMRSYLSEKDFNSYFPHKDIGDDIVLNQFNSIEEVKKYCQMWFWNDPDIEWSYVQAFSKIKDRVEELQHSLIEKKEFIRNFDDYYDVPWMLYKFYKVFEKFDCVERTEKLPVYKEVDSFYEKYGIDDGKPVGTLIGYHELFWIEARKTKAEFNYNNQTVILDLNDLELAFELGIDNLTEVCKLKLKYPHFGELDIKNFIK